MNEHKPLLYNFKKTQRKAVLKLVALLLVAVTLLLSSAWSWFRGEDDLDATTGQIGMYLQAINSLKIAVEATNDPEFPAQANSLEWDTSFDIMECKMSDGSKIMKDLDFVPATGLGHGSNANATYLSIPALQYNQSGGFSVNRDVAWSTPVENKDYISLKVSFTTDYPADIYIGEGTNVTTWSENNKYNLTDENVGNVSKEGNFSRDAIVGALRMSVYAPDTGSKFLWIPRPDVFLSTDVASDEYKLAVTKGEQSNCWSGVHEYYNVSKYITSVSGCAISAGAFDAVVGKCCYDVDRNIIDGKIIDTNGETVDVNTLTKIGSTKEGVVCSVYLKIWIEGCDSEAVQALSRGMFKLDINFVAVETG